jgi:hypothetical protein
MAADESPSANKSIESAFESTVARLTAKPGNQAVVAEWTYTNHWDIPLLVEHYDQSCGCLSGELSADGHQPVAPRKSGTIRAQFTPGNHRGLLRKSLHVRFVGHDKPVELVVEATIPSHVELSQRELIWKADDTSAAQVIEIKSGTGKPFTITSLQGLPKNQFTLTTETLTPGTHYRLSITPTASASGQHCLQVRTDSPDPRDSIQAVFLRVDPPSS